MRKILNIVKENLIVVICILIAMISMGYIMMSAILYIQSEKLQEEVHEQKHIEDLREIKSLMLNEIAKSEPKREEERRRRDAQNNKIQAELRKMAKRMEIGKIDILEKYQQRMDDVLIKSQTFVKKKPNEEDIELLANMALMESSWR